MADADSLPDPHADPLAAPLPAPGATAGDLLDLIRSGRGDHARRAGTGGAGCRAPR